MIELADPTINRKAALTIEPNEHSCYGTHSSQKMLTDRPPNISKTTDFVGNVSADRNGDVLWTFKVQRTRLSRSRIHMGVTYHNDYDRAMA